MKKLFPEVDSIRDFFHTRERDWLAPYAMQSALTKGRVHPEPEHPYRTCYQRDKDRIIHSAAFRRLEYKTQVFITSEGDYFRTRLTHTLEVSQISRTIARSLALNEDLVEAIALGHDVGHCPFGHAGEAVLHKLLENNGGFEHNIHGLRVFELLEQRYPNFPGLNLTFEVREGIAKHRDFYTTGLKEQNIEGQKVGAHPEGGLQQPTLESQVVDLADEIAYNNHDIDDGLRSDILDFSHFADLTIWKQAEKEVREKYSNLTSDQLRAIMINTLINIQVTDVINISKDTIQNSGIESAEQARGFSKPLIRFSPAMREEENRLKKVLWEHLYRNRRVLRMTDNACRVMEKLFRYYIYHLEQIPPSPDPHATPERRVADYIASMTDRSVYEEYKEVFMPPDYS